MNRLSKELCMDMQKHGEFTLPTWRFCGSCVELHSAMTDILNGDTQELMRAAVLKEAETDPEWTPELLEAQDYFLYKGEVTAWQLGAIAFLSQRCPSTDYALVKAYVAAGVMAEEFKGYALVKEFFLPSRSAVGAKLLSKAA